MELDDHPFDSIRPPEDLSPDGLRLWLEQVCQYLGISPTELSRAAGISPSTVNRFIVDPTGKKSLSSRTLSGLVRGATTIHTQRFSANYANLLGPGKNRREGFLSPPVRVAASVRAGVFKDKHIWPIQDQFFVSAPIPNSLGAKPVGLVVTDDHAQGVYPYGTVLIASRFSIESDGIELGDFFVVSRMDEERRTELTIRHFIVSPTGDMWLISQADYQKFRMPDAYLGRWEGDYKSLASPGSPQPKFSPSAQSGYVIEYRIISAIQPYSESFKTLTFPT
jgi:hypothetical protein